MSRNGRDKEGRFKPGNRCGRKAGVPNQATTDVRELKAHILNSWNAVDGDRLLARLAKRRPLDYVKLIASLLPREDVVQPRPFVVPDPSIHTPGALNFIDCLERERIAQGASEVTPAIVEEMLIRHSRGELDLNDDAGDPA